jgi:hypothetical protein
MLAMMIMRARYLKLQNANPYLAIQAVRVKRLTNSHRSALSAYQWSLYDANLCAAIKLVDFNKKVALYSHNHS